MISLPVIIKITVFTVVALFLAKTLAPTVGQAIWDLLYKPKKKKNKDMDFEFMIEQKKSMLRGGQASASGIPAGSSKQKSNTETVIHDSYKLLSSKSSRTANEEGYYQELKSFMGLLDSIQWGESKEFKELASQLTNKLAKRVSEADININFQALLKRELFLDHKDRLESGENIKILLESKIFFQHLLQDEVLQKSLSKRYSTGLLEVKKGLSVFFKKAQKKDSKNHNISVLKSPSPSLPAVDAPFLFALLKDRDGRPIKRVELLFAIKEEVEFFKTLSPLPKLKGKNDKEGAYSILGLKTGASIEQIKKQYKSLAKMKHPDRLKGKGIPQEFESIATENFTRIQEAYDILKSE